MVNVVPREVKRPKPKGPQTPRVLAEDPHTTFTMIPPRLFRKMSFL